MPALDHTWVVVTRPSHQAGELVRLVESEGGHVIRFPVLEIREPKDPGPLQRIIDRLEDFDIAVFISPNAVDRGMALIRAGRTLPPGLKIAAVGRGTMQALRRLGVATRIMPRDRFNSEALLATAAMQEVAGKHIVIFRGEGGRELLADTLGKRGARVEYAECYRRVRPATEPGELLRHWARGEVDVITVTSVEGIKNLFALLGEAGRPWLVETPMVVVSRRMAEVCRELGCRPAPLVAGEASDRGILNAIKAWRVAKGPVT